MTFRMEVLERAAPVPPVARRHAIDTWLAVTGIRSGEYVQHQFLTGNGVVFDIKLQFHTVFDCPVNVISIPPRTGCDKLPAAGNSPTRHICLRKLTQKIRKKEHLKESLCILSKHEPHRHMSQADAHHHTFSPHAYRIAALLSGYQVAEKIARLGGKYAYRLSLIHI